MQTVHGTISKQLRGSKVSDIIDEQLVLSESADVVVVESVVRLEQRCVRG